MLPGGVKRNYEVSIWTLQDSFITVLKPTNLEFKGQIQDPDMNIKDDGTLTFSFTIPMYLDGGLRENPIWYNTRNGVILADLRKLKVIFNKKQANEKIFEFLITKVSESHEKGQLMCKVESEGLAFHELGHKGLKVSFSLQDYLNDYNEWADSENPLPEEKPVNNLQYWCEKLLANSDWEYEVQMVWPGRTLAPNKVFEDEYVSSWALEGDRLVAQSVQDAQEKYRIVEVSDSNLYNITQTIAETFGVYCRYEYEYDHDYHIIGKKIIFFNNFIKEQDGPFDITYPYQTDKISRTMDGTDLCTKLYVTSVEDSTAPSGIISISTAAANKTKEDYILNFDYLHKIGTITEEQYAAVSEFEVEVRKINDQLDPLSEEIIELENELVEYEATKKIMDESVNKDREQLNQSQDLLNAITDNRGTVDLTKGNALSGILVEDFNNSTSGNVKYKIRLTTQGVLCQKKDQNSEYKIKLYTTLASIGADDNSYSVADGNFYTITRNNAATYLEYDNSNNIIGIKNIDRLPAANTYRCYIILSYRPALYNENVYAAFARKLAADTAERQKAVAMVQYLKKKLDTKRALYKTLIANKEKLIADFSNLMGPALREGQWSPDVYKDYGNSDEETLQLHAENPGCFLSFAFDSNYFDGEETLGATCGIDQTIKNYCLIKLTTDQLSAIQSANAWNDIAFMYSGTEFNANPALDTTYHINSQMFYVFVRDINGTSTVPAKPALLITGMTYDDSKWGESSEEKNPRISVKTTKTIEQNNLTNATIEVQEHKIFELTNKDIVSGANYMLLYPRITIPTLSVKISEDMLKVQLGHQASGFVPDKSLEMYSDYSILVRDDSYILTLNIQEIMKAYAQYGANIYARVNYSISNADTSIFLDAREVSQTNAWPQVSYDVAITLLKNGLWEDLYSLIGYIVNINDDELKFENVQGYISEISLKLDAPWNDSVKIKNYKTKFEDLFSTIVASSNIVQANAAIYDRTVSLFNSDGTIKQTIIQTTLNKMDLDYSFRNGKLTIDDVNGIWGASDDGVVAFTGGGIFTATEKDENDNWLWNTGIVPSGINASLINTGQLDTNLIRIFAGDNLRFQMNGEGLYAFRANDDGTVNLNQYVVHDSEGLTLMAKAGEVLNGNRLTTDVERVKISWDGITIRDNDNRAVLFMDENGNATFAGKLSADVGNFNTILTNNLITLGAPTIRITALDGREFQEEPGTFNRSPGYLSFRITELLFKLHAKDNTINEPTKIYIVEVNNGEETLYKLTPVSSLDNISADKVYLSSDYLTFAISSATINTTEYSQTYKIVCTSDDEQHTTYSEYLTLNVLRAGLPGQSGGAGDAAKMVQITGEQVFKYSAVDTVSPATIILTAHLQNVNMNKWQYKNSQGNWSDYSTINANLTSGSTTLEISPTHNIWIDDVATIRVTTSDNDVYDIFSIYKIRDGAKGKDGDPGKDGNPGKDSSVVFLTNENITFAGDNEGNVAPITITTNVVAYTGTTKITPVVGTPTGYPNGMTVVSGEGTINNEIPLTIDIPTTTNLGGAGPLNGVINISITSPVSTTLQIRWSKVNTGATGAPGLPATASYTATIVSSNGDKMKTTTDWTVLYCNVYQGDQWIDGYDIDYVYYVSNIAQPSSDIPKGSEYANKKFVYFNDKTTRVPSFAFGQYTSDGTSWNTLSEGARIGNKTFTWSSINAYGVSNGQYAIAPMIFVGPDAINTKATFTCVVS